MTSSHLKPLVEGKRKESHLAEGGWVYIRLSSWTLQRSVGLLARVSSCKAITDTIEESGR